VNRDSTVVSIEMSWPSQWADLDLGTSYHIARLFKKSAIHFIYKPLYKMSDFLRQLRGYNPEQKRPIAWGILCTCYVACCSVVKLAITSQHF